MLKNFLITSFRSLKRNKAYFFLGVTGLTLGISCVIALYTIINFQSNYDQHQENYDSIYRIIGSYKIGDDEGKTATVPHPLATGIREELPGVEAISNTYMLSAQINIQESEKYTTKINQEKIAFVQPDLFDILSFDWLVGSPSNMDLNSTYLSLSTAEKFFGSDLNLQSIMGKTIVLANEHNLTVGGIYADLPKNTDFPFDVICAYEKQEGVNQYYGQGKIWGRLNGGTQCVLKLAEGADPTQAQIDIKNAFNKYNQVEGYTLELQPLKLLHEEPIGSYSGVAFQPKYKVIAYTLAIFLALIGSINFINLTTARAIKRAREVGIRKVMGGRRSELVMQFILETFVIVLIALFVGFVVGEQFLILLDSFMGMGITISDVSVLDWTLLSTIVLIGMTLLSGLYPALVLSNFSALNAMKIRVSNIDKQSKIPVRKILVGLQFGFSISLIIGAIVILSQTAYMRSYDMGFKSDGIVNLRFPAPDFEKQTRLKGLFESQPEFEEVSLNLGSPLASTNNTDKYFNPEMGKEEAYTVNSKTIDENYLALFEIELVSGRNITSNDPHTNVLVTENALPKFNIGNPQEAIGKELEATWGGKVKIVGVVRDFNARSLRSEIMPVILMYGQNGFFEIAMKLSDNAMANTKETMKTIEEIWDTVYPELLIEQGFLEDQIAQSYRFEEIMGNSTAFFVVIAFIISVLGLYGLTDYMANAKRKEIGIRKVIGASISQILMIFGREVVFLLAISFAISATASFWLMNSWLEGFEYHISLGWEILLASLLATAFVSMLTMGSRSFAAAKVNPVEVLKDE